MLYTVIRKLPLCSFLDALRESILCVLSCPTRFCKCRGDRAPAARSVSLKYDRENVEGDEKLIAAKRRPRVEKLIIFIDNTLLPIICLADAN